MGKQGRATADTTATLCYYNEGRHGANGDCARGLAVPVTQGGGGCVGVLVRCLSAPLRGEVGVTQGLYVARLSHGRGKKTRQRKLTLIGQCFRFKMGNVYYIQYRSSSATGGYCIIALPVAPTNSELGF